MSGKKALKKIDGNQAPALFEPPSLELFERFSSILTGYEYDDYDDFGNKVSKVWPLETVGSNTELPDMEILLGLENELKAALITAGPKIGEIFTRRIIGQTGHRKMDLPDEFISEMTDEFAEAPADIGDTVVKQVRTNKYPNEVRHVAQALERLTSRRRRALNQVRAYILEHDRRDGKAAPLEELPKQIKWFRSLGPAIKAAIGADQFGLIWKELWLVRDDGTTMILGQPTRLYLVWTTPHLAAIGKVANRVCKLVLKQRPRRGSCKKPSGPRPIGDVMKGD